MVFSAPFRTRSEIVPCKNQSVPGVSLCALDIGYSAVKGFSATNRFCFPSYVRANAAETIGAAMPTDIRYRGEDGVVYAVGNLAIESLSSKDTNDAANTMFGRNRYFSPSFLILARVGLALAFGDGEANPVYLQTGLPPAYRKGDTPLLKEALAGHHEFSVKLGGGDWKHYCFDLPQENIYVMDQPIGSVYSASKRNDGTTALCPDGSALIDHKLLVLDGGFGTLDVFSIANRFVGGSNTFNDLGMKAIFEATSNEIFEQYGKEVYAHTLQNCLLDGTITVFDRKTRSTKRVDITPILREKTKQICDMAMQKIESAYDDLEDYDYLLVTGGTGAAWFDMLRDRYKGMETLGIIAANQNEKMPPVYNNVRGYYIYRALAAAQGR